MSVNGKPNEGDVYLEEDGYIVCYLKNSNKCWYRLYLGPEHKGDSMWLSDANTDAITRGKKLMNIKELLISVRKELQDEPSS
jgi:hypothetical protein